MLAIINGVISGIIFIILFLIFKKYKLFGFRDIEINCDCDAKNIKMDYEKCAMCFHLVFRYMLREKEVFGYKEKVCKLCCKGWDSVYLTENGRTYFKKNDVQVDENGNEIKKDK